MAEVERLVRSIECDGLKWGASKLVKVAFGISKLQINCIVEDDKVGTDFLEEEITKFEDHVSDYCQRFSRILQDGTFFTRNKGDFSSTF